MKFTQEQLIEFATKAGVPVVEVVADSKEADYDETSALQAVQAATTTLIKPAIESELRTSIEAALRGKMSGETYSLLARESGMTRAELEKLPVTEAAKVAFTHLTTKLGKDSAQWKEEMDKLIQTHNDTDATKEKEWNGKLTAATERYVNRDINAFLRENIVGKAALLETADKDYWAEQLRTHLQSKYHLSYDDAKKAVATFQKDKPEIPALNEAGTATINLMEEFNGMAKRAGVLKTDTRTKVPNPNPAPNHQQQVTPSTQQRASQGKGRKVTAEQKAEYFASIENAGE